MKWIDINTYRDLPTKYDEFYYCKYTTQDSNSIRKGQFHFVGRKWQALVDVIAWLDESVSDQGDVWREIQVEERLPVKDDNYFVFTALHSGGHTFRKGRRSFFKDGCFKIDNAPGDEYVTSWLEKHLPLKTEDKE